MYILTFSFVFKMIVIVALSLDFSIYLCYLQELLILPNDLDSWSFFPFLETFLWNYSRIKNSVTKNFSRLVRTFDHALLNTKLNFKIMDIHIYTLISFFYRVWNCFNKTKHRWIFYASSLLMKKKTNEFQSKTLLYS